MPQFVVAMLLLVMPALAVSQEGRPGIQRVRSEMLVSTSWLADHLRDKNVIILHVAREKNHYEASHIPGARFLLWSEFVTMRDGIANELPPVEQLQQVFGRLGVGNTARIIIYGDTAGLSAARAYFTLDYLGHGHRAALLDGGLEKWKSEGRTVSTDAVAAEQAEFTPNIQAGSVTTLNVMRDYSSMAASLSAPKVAIIDARPDEQYAGSAVASSDQRSGHIPGATSLYWTKEIVSRENPAMRAVSELQQLFESAGVKPGDKVVTYCTSGVQASYSYFVAKYLGYDVTMYDGSFSEWSKAEGTKVVSGQNPK